MPLQQGSSQKAISENIAKLTNENYSTKQAAAIAYSVAKDDAPSARQYDINGWYEIQNNPISKVGVFQYLGKNIPGCPDPLAFYGVYRPADELGSPETIASFRLVPWITGHTLLGAGGVAAEKKGIEGVTGENVYFDTDTLYSNIKVFSETLEETIDMGKVDLSLGYRCVYEKAEGTFDGVPYQYIQRRIRGNHLASVDEGRMGAEVAVMDGFTFTIDSKEFKTMADENTESNAEATPAASDLDNLATLLKQAAPIIEQLVALQSALGGQVSTPVAADEEALNPADRGTGMDAEAETETKEEKEKAVAMDSIEFKNAVAKEVAKALKAAPTMDAKDVFKEIKTRDTLASQLSHFVGTFDHSEMTAQDVAVYGVEKLAIPHVVKGQEISAVSAFLHGRTVPSQAKTFVAGTGFDSNESGSVNFVQAQLAEVQ